MTNPKCSLPTHLKIKLLSLILGLILHPAIVCSQKFSIVKINTTNFPELDATFEATNSFNEVITNSKPEDFTIIENGETREIIKVINPSITPVPISVAIMVDVSSSMDGERAALSREGIKDLIRQFPLETSEMAIGSFRNVVAVNSDFTQSKSKLLYGLENMVTSGSTSFDNAFMLDGIGALNLAYSGRFKKAVVFITDGLSYTLAEQVIEMAKNGDITVFVINVSLKAPDELKKIANQTNGKCFESITTIEQVRSINAMILQTLQSSKYGQVFWKSATNCSPTRNTFIKYTNITHQASYEVPAEKQGILETDPATLIFGTSPVGKPTAMNVDLVSKNIPFTISNLSIINKTVFGLPDSLKLPFTIEANKTYSLAINYLPKDAGIVNGKLIITSKECPEKSVNLTAGNEENVRIVFPQGGEVFATNADTLIRWEGIKKTRRVEVHYRMHPDSLWQPLGEGSRLTHHWTTPFDTSHLFQVKVTPISSMEEELGLKAKLTGHRASVNTVTFSPNGSHIVSTDKYGAIKIWKTDNGKLQSSLEGFKANCVLFGNDNDRMASLTNNEILVWDIRSQKLIYRMTSENKKVYASRILTDGTEVLLPATIFRDKANTYKIWDPAQNFTHFVFSNEAVKSAAFSADKSRVLTLAQNNQLQIWDTKTKNVTGSSILSPTVITAIINPNGKTVLFSEIGLLTMADMTGATNLFHLKNQQYQRFSKSGDMLICKDTLGYTTFFDALSGNLLFTLANASFFRCSSKGSLILYGKKDTIALFDAAKQRYVFKNHNSFIASATFTPDDSKIIVVRKENEIEIIDTSTGTSIDNINDFDQKINRAEMAPDNTHLLLVMDNNTIQVWGPKPKKQNHGATSNYFGVVSPSPEVVPQVLFGEVLMGSLKEKLVPAFIRNSSPFPIKILTMEVAKTDTSTFEIVSNRYPLVLQPHSERVEEFRFIPKKIGLNQGTLRTITANDTFLTSLKGVGLECKFWVNPKAINFGKVPVFQWRDTVAVLIKNISNDTLTILKIENSGPDKSQFLVLDQAAPKILLPYASFHSTMRFSPLKRGKTSGSITLTIANVTDPQEVPLFGEGVAPRELFVTGITRNSKDSLPINAKVNCTDLETGKLIKSVQSNELGKYGFTVSADRQYSLTAQKPNFISGSESVDLTGPLLTDTLKKDIYLTPIVAGATIRMNCVFFESAKATLLPVSQTELNRLADILKQYPGISVEIHGHTDSIGSNTSNLTLATNRANAVRQYLIKKGILPIRMQTKAFGEDKPIAQNSTDEGRQLNRRVEVRISGVSGK